MGLFFNRSAVEWIRTTTLLRAPAPQAGASASSATTAKDLWFATERLCLYCDRFSAFKFHCGFRKIGFSHNVVSRKHGVGFMSCDPLRNISIHAGPKQIARGAAPEIM